MIKHNALLKKIAAITIVGIFAVAAIVTLVLEYPRTIKVAHIFFPDTLECLPAIPCVEYGWYMSEKRRDHSEFYYPLSLEGEKPNGITLEGDRGERVLVNQKTVGTWHPELVAHRYGDEIMDRKQFTLVVGDIPSHREAFERVTALVKERFGPLYSHVNFREYSYEREEGKEFPQGTFLFDYDYSVDAPYPKKNFFVEVLNGKLKPVGMPNCGTTGERCSGFLSQEVLAQKVSAGGYDITSNDPQLDWSELDEAFVLRYGGRRRGDSEYNDYWITVNIKTGDILRADIMQRF